MFSYFCKPTEGCIKAPRCKVNKISVHRLSTKSKSTKNPLNRFISTSRFYLPPKPHNTNTLLNLHPLSPTYIHFLPLPSFFVFICPSCAQIGKQIIDSQ